MTLITNPHNPIYDLFADGVTGTWTHNGTIDSAYPITNIFSPRPWEPAKWTVNPTVILVDHTTAKRIDIISFIHTNLDGTVVIKRNALDSGWGTPSMSISVVIPGTDSANFPKQPWVDLTAVAGYNGATGYRYTRFEITQTALLSAGLWRLGSTLRQLGTNIAWGSNDRKRYHALEFPTEGSINLGYEVGTRERKKIGNFVNINNTNIDAIEAWFDYNHRPRSFLLIPDPAVNDAWWVRWGEGMEWFFDRLKVEPNINSLPVAFEEVGRGLIP